MSLSPPSAMDAALKRTLVACIPELQRHCADPWVVIGSTAARLAGAEVTVADIDVLTSARDARALAGHWQARLLATDTAKDADRFRSQFARFDFPVPVEVMGDLELASPDGWTAVRVAATRTVQIDGVGVPIPTLAEQLRLLEAFGRPKDRERAERLRRLQEHPGAASP
jgi:hypothetical protein